MWSQLSAKQVQGHLKVNGAVLLDWPQTMYMWSQLEAEQAQGHLKVIGAFITGGTSNYVHVITIGGRRSSRSSQGHRVIDYWIGLKLSTCDRNWVPNKFKVISRSMGHYYWIGLKLSTCDHNWGPKKFKVIPRSSGNWLLDWPQT